MKAKKREPKGRRMKTTADDDVRVITLSWQVIVLPVLAFALVVFGYMAGTYFGTPAAEPAPPQQSLSQQSTAPGPRSAGPEAQGVLPGQPVGANPGQGGQPVSLPPSSHPLIGQKAPDFTMTLLESGEEVSLSDYHGSPLMVNFWATWCPPCRFEMPWIQRAFDEHRDSGFVVLGVNAGERVPPSMLMDTVSQFTESMGLTFPMLAGDSTLEVQRSWTVTGLPATFFIDSEGVVVDVHKGMFPNEATLTAEVQELLGG